MTCRSSGPEIRAGWHRMGKGFPSRMILRCRKKKLETIHSCAPRPYKHFWQKGSPCVCNVPGKGIRQQVPIFQHSFSATAADILCIAGKAPLSRTGERPYAVYSFDAYAFRWPIKVSYYEQNTFWSLCSYMVHSRKGVEMLVNLINIAYCVMKLLPYQDEAFLKYHTESVQYSDLPSAKKSGSSYFMSIS